SPRRWRHEVILRGRGMEAERLRGRRVRLRQRRDHRLHPGLRARSGRALDHLRRERSRALPLDRARRAFRPHRSAESTEGIPTSIAVSPVDHGVVWVATGTGSVYRYDVDAAGDTTATQLNDGLPNRSISRIVAGYDSAGSVYAVFSGYDANTPATPGKVFVSRNG